jgi:hypothetical protein
LFAEANELVVLANDLGCAFGEVEGEGGLVGAEVIDVEDELLRKVFRGSPDDPADTWVDETILRSRLGKGSAPRVEVRDSPYVQKH